MVLLMKQIDPETGQCKSLWLAIEAIPVIKVGESATDILHKAGHHKGFGHRQ